MATKIVTKNSSTSGSAPLASDLVQGELAVNVADKRLFTEDNGGSIVELGTNPSTLTVTGEITANGGIALGDNDKATFGAGDDLQIYHDGSDSYVDDAGTGDLVLRGNNQVLIRDTGTNEVMGNFRSSGAVTLYYDNAEKISTTATGIDVTGNASFADNGKATFGAGDDLQIYHDGSHSYIDDVGGTGNLKVRATNLVLQSAIDENYATFVANGAASLFYDNAEKLATTSTGIDVTGTATMDGLTVEGNGALFTLDNGSNAATLSNTNGNVVLDYDAAEAGRSFTVQQNGRKSLRVNNSGDVSFYEDTGTTAKFFWDASAESLGIGTSSPTALLHLSSTAPSILMQDSDGTGRSSINCDNGSLNLKFNSNNAVGTSVLTFSDFNTERMRIDSSGNLLVGKTAAAVSSNGIEVRNDGLLVVTRDSNKAAILNRRSSDGDILEFMKDSAAVGSIGSNSGTRAYLVLDPRTAYKGAGITGSSIDANTSNIIPTDKNGTIANGDINLGYASSRWKNLYLSGGVYLGGTGDANKLDDYEEGDVTGITCTGSTSGSATVIINNATYTKIGNVVNLYLYLTMDFSGDDIVGDIEITNLPFSNANNNLQNVSIIHQTISTTYLTLGARVTSNSLRVQTNSTSSGLARADCVNSANRVMMIGATYNTDA